MNTVTISFVIQPDDGAKPTSIAVTYPDSSWADILNLEKAVIPAVLQSLFALGEQYAAAVTPPK